MSNKAVLNRDLFFTLVKQEFGDVTTIERKDIIALVDKYEKKLGLKWPAWFMNDPARRMGRGLYSLADNPTAVPARKVKTEPLVATVPVSKANLEMTEQDRMSLVMQSQGNNVAPAEELVSLVPERVNGYVPFGHFNDVRSMIKSRMFYPAYITGLSGNGKTMMVEQVCASEGRECVRVNITIETDEDDLLGGFRLVDGKTVWQNGPVIVAMERGAVLLLDEVDLGSNKMMCLQPVLEGHSIYLKKINKVVKPQPGFNIIATANTKGKGSDDGRFIGTNIMNEAFLERFKITFEQEYPNLKTEARILQNVLKVSNITENAFVEKLVMWADVIRKSYAEGAVSEIISTRRLVAICEAYAIFGQDKLKAIELCLNRFDTDTKNAFNDLYQKLDESAQKKAANVAEAIGDDQSPF